MQWIKFITRHTAGNPANREIALSLNLQDADRNDIRLTAQAAVEKAGYILNVLDSKGDAALQLYQVISARKRGTRAMMIILEDPDDADAILQETGNMKVVFLAVAPADLSLLNKNAVFIGPDDVLTGKLQGQFLASYYRNKGQSEINYILMQALPEAATTRMESVLQTLSDQEILATQAAAIRMKAPTREKAKLEIMDLLKSDVNFDAMISNHDAIALGAIDAMEFLNVDLKQVTIVSVNITPPTREAIRENKLLMTVFQNPRAQVLASITAIFNMFEGKPWNENIEYRMSNTSAYEIRIPPDIVTKTLVPENFYFTV